MTAYTQAVQAMVAAAGSVVSKAAYAQYADLLKMQLVRVVGHIIGPEHEVIVVVKNTMDNLNLTYRVSVSDFLSSRFDEVAA